MILVAEKSDAEGMLEVILRIWRVVVNGFRLVWLVLFDLRDWCSGWECFLVGRHSQCSIWCSVWSSIHSGKWQITMYASVGTKTYFKGGKQFCWRLLRFCRMIETLCAKVKGWVAIMWGKGCYGVGRCYVRMVVDETENWGVNCVHIRKETNGFANEQEWKYWQPYSVSS